MEWFIVLAGAALGILPFAHEVRSGISENRLARQREEEARQQAVHQAKLHQLDQREQVLMLETRQGLEDEHLQDELDRIHIERMQLTGREL